LDAIAFPNLPDRTARESFWADMADACAGGNAGETRVGNHRDLLAEGKMLERRGDLIDFFHARPHGATANEHDHVAGVNGFRFDRGDGSRLGDENAGRADLAIDAVRIDDRRVDRRAFDDASFGRKIAARKGNG
jgi:hypothetical protein